MHARVCVHASPIKKIILNLTASCKSKSKQSLKDKVSSEACVENHLTDQILTHETTGYQELLFEGQLSERACIIFCKVVGGLLKMGFFVCLN